MSIKNPAFEMTEVDAAFYLNVVVRDAPRAIQKIFFDCMRVARKLNIELPCRTFLAEFFSWLDKNIHGVVEDFLRNFTPREVFERSLHTSHRCRHEQRAFWIHATSNTLQ